MASNIIEFFGYAPTDQSHPATESRKRHLCPWVGGGCTKVLRDGTISGACTLKPVGSGPVIICPIRLYADQSRVLLDVAELAFGQGVRLVRPQDVGQISSDGCDVAVFGKRWGKELRLPARGG